MEEAQVWILPNSPLSMLTFETLKDGSPPAFPAHSVGYSTMFISVTSYIFTTLVMGWHVSTLRKIAYGMNYIFIHPLNRPTHVQPNHLRLPRLSPSMNLCPILLPLSLRHLHLTR